MISCLIIENSKNTIGIINTVGKDFNDIIFNDVIEDQEVSLSFILKNKPEIVFINIDSTKINLVEFLFEFNQYCEINPYFVALSNSKEKAFDSYRLDFSDFILKPLNDLNVRKSFLKYQKKHPIKQIERICLKSYKDYQYLNFDEILYLKADNNTTDFHIADGSIIVIYKTLKVFENLLPQTFLRIHKSYIINRNFISRIHFGKSICVINNEHKIPFTKTYIANVDLINRSLSKNTMITLN